MRLFSEKDLPPHGSILTIGNFDGVHIGHQKLIKRVIEIAYQKSNFSLAVTFEPHPRRVLGHDPNLCMISSFEHKSKLLSECGLDGLWVIPFDLQFAKTPAAQFIKDVLYEKIKFSSMVVSEKYFFGKDRIGNASLLKDLSKELGFSIEFISSVMLDDETISSTRIRELIRLGRLADAARILGRPFSIYGIVEKGQGIGHKIGFPTANLNTHHELLPPRGVYAVDIKSSEDVVYQGVANIGIRPTVSQSSDKEVIEIHLFDVEEDFLNTRFEVVFHAKLRDERKFENLDQLKNQIHADVLNARNILGNPGAV